MGTVAQLAKPGDMVGMQVSVDGLDQFEIKLAQQLAVAVDLLQHGIENQRFAAGAAGQDVAVGSGYAIEQLAKDHEWQARELIPDTITPTRRALAPADRT